MSDLQSSTALSPDGVPIRHAIEGSGEPTLLFVHGWAFDRHLWDPDVRRLGRRYRVVTLDLAGHGESGADRRRWTMAAFGEDVKAVADAVRPGRLVLIGHSMGGLAVLEAARRMKGRVQAIVLVDIVLDAAQRMPADEIEAYARQLEADYDAATRHMVDQFLLGPATPPAVREHVIARTTTALPPALSIALLREVWAYDPGARTPRDRRPDPRGQRRQVPDRRRRQPPLHAGLRDDHRPGHRPLPDAGEAGPVCLGARRRVGRARRLKRARRPLWRA
jgi:pimeloyl-ACP methyl ester carboxylesterase